VMPGSKCKVVEDAKDLKPLRVKLFRCTRVAPGAVGVGGSRGRTSPYPVHGTLGAGVP